MSPPLKKKKTQPAPSFDEGLDLREPKDDLPTVKLRGDGSYRGDSAHVKYVDPPNPPLRDLQEMDAKTRGRMSDTDEVMAKATKPIEVMVEVGDPLKYERKPFPKLSKTLRFRGNR